MRTFPLEFALDAVADEENVSPDGYSGRGMYGETCASVSFDSINDALRFFATLGEIVGRHIEAAEVTDLDTDLHSLMRAVTVDGLGRGIVAYFPGWTFA